MEQLTIRSFGPIEEVDVEFGDLTLLVGPQASGKSIFLELLKLLIDKYHIRKTLQQYNYLWKEIDVILNLYFGEGMSKIWTPDTCISRNGQNISKDFLLPKKGRGEGKSMENPQENLFYIPAQRILSVSDGRPKTFMEFDSSAPYVLRQFSETLRLMLQNDDLGTSIFPNLNRLKGALRNSFDESIFHGGKVVMDNRNGQKKLRLEVDDMSVPFITWSAGQKEFMPLLMGFYWLCPPSKVSRKDHYQYVVIEEPEMGLHPQAIKSVILQVIDLLSRGYKVIISTHSPVLLEFAWAFNLLKNSKADNNALNELFDLKSMPLFKNILTDKSIRTYFFSRDNKENRVVSKDITSLDAGSDDPAIAEWGGLSQFSGKATDIILKYLD